MTWQETKAIAEQWVQQHLAGELRGRVLQLVKFETDHDSRFFYPGRTAMDHYQITSGIARQARKQKVARTVYATVTTERYYEWCKSHGLEDSSVLRNQFINSCHVLSENQ